MLFTVFLAAFALAEPWEHVPTRADGIWYQARLGANTPDGAAIILRAYVGELELFVETEPVYSFREQRGAGRITIHVIELPRRSAGKRLFARVPSSAHPPFLAGTRVVDRADIPVGITKLIGEPLQENLVDLLVGALIASFGLIAMILSAIRRRGDARTLFYFGAFAFLYGARLLMQSMLLPLAGVSIRTAEQVEWIITYIITIPGWALADRLIGAGWKSSLRLQVWAFALFAPIGIASDLIRREPGSMEVVNNVLVIAGGINVLPFEVDETPGFLAFLGTLG